ncbi:MAG TPA: hypothetical protein VIH09_08895 [Flavobacterium sp.]|uniref:hypothetical protein n=1 Tax=Flavobacterium sp. TaxID=239 RepID=UPI002F40BF88
MKKSLNISAIFKKSLLLCTLLFSQSILWAQEKSIDVNLNVDKGGNDWYAEPWVMVVGGAVFIIIIVALLRGKK